MAAKIYVVPVTDVSWDYFAPLNAKRNFVHDPPPVDQCLKDVRDCNALMRRVVDGKFVQSPQTGTYARDTFFTKQFLDLYAEAVASGAEMVIHPHEQIAGVGVRFHEVDHMTEVVTSKIDLLKRAGVEPVGFRGGHFVYLDYFTPLFEKLGLLIDLSGRPGFVAPIEMADWTGAPFSAYYLSREDYRKPAERDRASRVFEIPIGTDGVGNEDSDALYVERYDCRPVWDAIVSRAEQEGRSQFIYMLFHTASMHHPGRPERFEQFVEYLRRRQGVIVTATECRERWLAYTSGRAPH